MIALVLMQMVIALVHAESPVIRPPSPPSPVPQPSLTPPPAGCHRVFSESFTAAMQRPAARGESGTCALARPDEEQRQLSQSNLDCLAKGYEDSTELKVTCTRTQVRQEDRVAFQLQFSASWRCYRTECSNR